MTPLCPTFYYPLAENPPSLGASQFRVDGFSDVLFPFLNSLDHAPRWVRNLHGVYDRQHGFFRFDPVDPHVNVGLAEIGMRLFILRTHGFLDRLNDHIPDYSVDDVVQWLLHHVFAGARNPFRKKSLYRYAPTGTIHDEFMGMVYASRRIGETLSCKDVASALTMLHLLGRLHDVAGVCDPEALGNAFAALQGRDGLIRPFLDPYPVDGEPGETALHTLVAIHLLDSYFGTQALDRLETSDLARGLAALVARILENAIDPHLLHRLYELVAALHLLGTAWADEALMVRVQDSVMESLGLHSLWMEYKREHSDDIDSLFGGLEFAKSTSGTKEWSRLTANFPAGKTAEAGCFSVFPTVAMFSTLGASGGVGLLLGVLNLGNPNIDRQHLTWRFEWNSLTLPFVLRHYPLLEVSEPPFFCFRSEGHVALSLRNVGARPISRMLCRFGPGRYGVAEKTQLSLVFATKRKRFRIRLKGAQTCRKLMPSGEGTLRVSLESRSLYPRYPHLGLSDLVLVLRCRYGSRNWTLSLDELTVQMLPRRSHVTAVISREATKARYDPHWTLGAIKSYLRQRGVTAAESLVKRLYREFLPDSVERWIRQFEPEARPAVLKLHRAIRYYSIEDTRQLLAAALRSLPRDVVRHAAFLGLGKHLAKSGTHLLYFIKHTYRELFPRVSSQEVTLRFQPVDALKTAVFAGTLKVDALIFVDDFFGSGKTTTDDLARLARMLSNLWKLPKYYIAVTGFQRGRQRIVDSFPEMAGRILTGDDELTDRDRAFAWPTRIFSSMKEFREAKRICASVGEALLRKRVRSKRKRSVEALGWDGDEALIVFEHNTPNNTLPIFWAKGIYRGIEWQPLYPRRE